MPYQQVSKTEEDNPDVHSILLNILRVTIVTIFAIHHGRGAMMFVAQPRVFVSPVSVILLELLRGVVIRGTKDPLILWTTEFRINHVPLYNHPLAEVASRKHEVLHLLVVPLHGARRAGRGICRWVAVLGCSTQVVIFRVPFASFSHATGKPKSPHPVVFEITALHLFATIHLAQFSDAKPCRFARFAHVF